MKKIIHSDNAPKAVGPYSQAIKSGNFIFTSGQIPLDPKTGKLVEGDIQQQTKQVMSNLEQVLKAGGADFSNVVKVTVYLANIADFSKVNEIYAQYFSENPPARSAFQVAALPLGASLEIEMIAQI